MKTFPKHGSVMVEEAFLNFFSVRVVIVKARQFHAEKKLYIPR